MSLYVVRACRCKKGTAAEVKTILQEATRGTAKLSVYQSSHDPHDFGIFAEFANEDEARAFAASKIQAETTTKLTPLVEFATAISVWKPV